MGRFIVRMIVDGVKEAEKPFPTAETAAQVLFAEPRGYRRSFMQQDSPVGPREVITFAEVADSLFDEVSVSAFLERGNYHDGFSHMELRAFFDP